MKKIILASLLMGLFVANSIAQEQPKHEKKWIVDENGNLYYNKQQPVYFWISTSPTDNSGDVLLKSEETPQYTNPSYLDTDGYNSLRISPAVNNKTKKIDAPRHDMRFEINTDGTPPETKSTFSNADTHHKNNKTFYGKGLEIELFSDDEIAGVEKIYYSTNGENFKEYSGKIEPFDENENFVIKYYAVDKLGNTEKITEKTFGLDLTAPLTVKKINGEVHGNVLSQDATISLETSDNMSGVKATYFSIDNDKAQIYTQPISAYAFLGGEHTLSFYAVDNVGNSSFGDTGDNTNPEFSLNFTVDKSAPTLDFQIIGDEYEGSRTTYISDRSKFKITAKDDISEIDYIKFSYDAKGYEIYDSEKFFTKRDGYQTIKYYATDIIQNSSSVHKATVYMDRTAPISFVEYGEPQFFHRDTLFINKDTEISILANDSESGIKKKEYAIDGQNFSVYNNSFKIEKNGYHSIDFKTTDNVNNVEQTKNSYIVVDNQGPEIYVNFSIQPIRYETKNGKQFPVYPPYSKMYLAATDKNTGEEKIYFSINGGKEMKYSSADNIQRLKLLAKEQFYSIKITATDKLGNKNEKTIGFFIAEK